MMSFEEKTEEDGGGVGYQDCWQCCTVGENLVC